MAESHPKKSVNDSQTGATAAPNPQDARREGRSANADETHAPQQKRSAATQANILKAVTELLEADAYMSATVQDIVTAAGCSVGAFYGRFKDKDAALFTLYEARCCALEKASAAMLSRKDVPLAESLAGFIDLVINHSTRHTPILRAGLIAPATKNIAPFAERVRTMNARLIDKMAALLNARADEHSHEEPRRAALYVVAIVGGFARDGVIQNIRLADSDDSLTAFVAELRRIVYGYLRIN